jgi:alkylation response protein AidB-like acyl-CoA dehydrogenase
MDFATRLIYTEEQEVFRKEVRAWLDENAKMPEGVTAPRESAEITKESEEWALEYRRKLGEKGWFSPLWPKEYGGGGLSTDQAQVLSEEMALYEVPGIYDNRLAAPAIMVWGTEEQKKRFLPLINRAELITWQAFTEPEVGSDAASIKTTAIRDGDDFIVNGTKVYIGGPSKPDYLWTTTVTDPNAPRHQNMGTFYIPVNLDGISFSDMELIVNSGKHFIYYDNVRVPGEYLIGGEGNGWRVTQTSLEIEHGAGGNLGVGEGGGRGGSAINGLLQYAKETTRDGVRISSDAHIRQTLVQSYIDTQIVRLIGMRNYWMFNSKQRMTYHGSQSSLMGKHLAMTLGNAMMQVAGPFAMINDDKWAPLNAAFEVHQRSGITAHHPGGSSEIQKLIMARRLGLSRTREEAAPTEVA